MASVFVIYVAFFFLFLKNLLIIRMVLLKLTMISSFSGQTLNCVPLGYKPRT